MLGFICEVTPKCNLSCSFCYNTWRDPNVPQPTPLAVDDFAHVLISTLGESQAKWLAFAGGEPLLYAKLDELMGHVHKALPSVKIGLLSNGLALTEKRLATLKTNGLQYVEISLFSASNQRYANLAGATDNTATLKHAHNAMLAVKASQLPLTVACTLLAPQIDEFEQIVLSAFALGADQFALNPFTPTGYGKQQQQALTLSADQLAQLLAQANALASQLSMPIAVTLPIEDCVIPHARYPHLQFSACQCAINKWAIDPEGYLRTCEQNSQRLGSLREHSFATLSTLAAVTAFLQNNSKAECTTCPSFAQCGGGCRCVRMNNVDELLLSAF